MQRVIYPLLVVIIAFSPAITVWADTSIPGGNVSGVWDLEGSPYLIEGDITVPTGQMLTIEPGVTVFFESWYSLTVNGHLHAVGTENDSILFTATPAGPGEPGWKGIRFVDAEEGHLSSCIIENGKVTAGDPFDRGGAMYISNSSPEIRNSTLRNNWAGSRGGAIYINQGSPVIADNLITNNFVGYNPFGYGGGIYVINSQAEIIGNTISENAVDVFNTFSFATGRGGAIYLNNSDALVERNLIIGNLVDASGNVGTEASGGGIEIWSADPQIVNNTLGGNSATVYTAGSYGGGLHLYFANPTIINNIVEGSTGGGIYFELSSNTEVGYNNFYGNDDDFLGSGIPAGLGDIVTVNANGDPSDIYYNIFLNPLFVDPGNGNYNLQAASPCIDAGDPASPPDPDGTVADIGAFYYDQGGMPMVEITLTPYNPPIVIPANGGSFSFNVDIANGETEPVSLAAWIMVQLPDGSWFGPLVGPVNLTLAGSTSLNRDRSQTVPSGAPAGTYSYEGYVGVYPNTVWDSDSFTFEKSTVGGGLTVSGWKSSGEGFEPWLSEPAGEAPSEFTLIDAYPNPFNPVTTISFALPEATRITLNVFDISGRLVTTLADGWRDAGTHDVSFDAAHLSSGVYIYLLNTGRFTASGKFMLVK